MQRLELHAMLFAFFTVALPFVVQPPQPLTSLEVGVSQPVFPFVQ